MNMTCPLQATALGEFDYRIIIKKWKQFTAHLVQLPDGTGIHQSKQSLITTSTKISNTSRQIVLQLNITIRRIILIFSLNFLPLI